MDSDRKNTFKKDTKLKADIAEYAAVQKLLQKGFCVLKPVGDRMPYDLAVDKGNKTIRLQVKSAWKQKGLYIVDSRRTKTNRREMIRSRYDKTDFDFALLYIEEVDVFYVMPVEEFNSYKSGIALVETQTRQRRPRSYLYREAWHLIEKFSIS